MSVTALTTAMTVAAAAVPNGNASASAASVATVLAAADRDQWEVATAAGAEALQSSATAQAPASPQSSEPQNPIHLGPAEPARPIIQVPATQTDSQASPPGGEQEDIIVVGRKPNPADPLEELNSQSYEVAQTVDKSFVAPVAFAYGEIMPRPVRKGLRNFLHNLGEPVVFINYMLQLKPGKAAETLGRFAINTTLGWGGVIDIAKRKPFNLPHRENGFANTLGYYGVKPGPYFYLPLVGPTTLRDFIGGRLDLMVMPAIFPKWFARKEIVTPVWVLSELGRRLEFNDELTRIHATLDPYVAARTYYLQKRQAEIDALHGRKASADTSTAPAATPPPVPDRPEGQMPAGSSGVSSIGSDVGRQLLDAGQLAGNLSLSGAGRAAPLAVDFADWPAVDLRAVAVEWGGRIELAW
ncbi:MlaA family lipoprotein [Sphingomonas alba]|uniref:VacJ family lipoprotein n=1 Tax=Sphingomonas alba TaxID=2908208 RepID=A0ABT0RMA4_9SPHN|nr:VacJ family lipoprotein [Sphingomonas alba]MCL6683768.1 VacJ family lipoprotein [Sphingomonas alba]